LTLFELKTKDLAVIYEKKRLSKMAQLAYHFPKFCQNI